MTSGGKHDWDVVAEHEPWFGVISTPEFTASAMDENARARFYATGEDNIDQLLAWFDADVGARPSGGRAFDFGCGVGRLTYAIARHCDSVVGYDVAGPMLAIARENAPANAQFVQQMPDGPFDWINSFIVFQHIPPSEGLKLMEACLARAAPSCFLSLQVTGWREAAQTPRPGLPGKIKRALDAHASRTSGKQVERLIVMHDYNFSDVLRVVTAAGFTRLSLRHTNHSGHHGAWILARRGA